jgi:hypothetical protein
MREQNNKEEVEVAQRVQVKVNARTISLAEHVHAAT